MPKKGTPQYDAWLIKYKAKQASKGIKPKKKATPKVLGTEVSLADRLPNDTEALVYSKSQGRDIPCKVIRWESKHNKYFVHREDSKYLYYAHDQLKVLEGERDASKAEAPASLSWSNKIDDLVKAPTLDIMKAGMLLDLDVLKSIDAEIQAEQTKVLTDLRLLIGRDINVGSWRDVQKVIYEEMGMEDISGRMATNKETLSAMNEPVCDLIVKARSNNKLLSGYTTNLPKQVSKDGRIRNQLIPAAVSGRFTCSGVLKLVDVEHENPGSLAGQIWEPDGLFGFANLEIIDSYFAT